MKEYGDKMSLFLDSMGNAFPVLTGGKILVAWLVFKEKAREIDLSKPMQFMQSIKVTDEMIDNGDIPF